MSDKENTFAEEYFYNRKPDLIVVFTGDIGRINFALQKASKYNQSNIFITGVYAANTVDTLINGKSVPANINTELMEIDYIARNTVENVISTMRYLKNNKGIKEVLIISHDYHLMRIKLLTNALKPLDNRHRFHFLGLKTDYVSYRNIKILFKEVFKLFKAHAFLLLWDTEQVLDSNNTNLEN